MNNPENDRAGVTSTPPRRTKLAEHEHALHRRKGDPLHDDHVKDLIEQLQTTGERDSTGVFTISTDKAREKLSQFALPNPRLYVLNLVASAIAGGATSLEVTVKPSGVTFEYSGAILQPASLEQLWSQLLNPANTSLHELATALNAARTLDPAELSVESWDAERGGCRLQVRGDQLQMQSLQQPSWDRTVSKNRVTVVEPALRGSMRYLFGMPEWDALRAYALLGPARVSLNDREASRNIRLEDSPTGAAWLHLVGNTAGLKLERPDSEWSPCCLILGPRQAPDDFEAVLALGLPQPNVDPGLTLICNGVSFRRPAHVLGNVFSSGVVSTGRLRKNLSHTDLAEDEDYRTLLDTLQRQVELLILERLEATLPLPPELVPKLLAYAPELVRKLRARGMTEEAQAVRRWQKEAKFTRNLLDGALWTSLRSDLEGLGDSPAGQALQTRLRRTLRHEGKNLLESGLTHQSAQIWERLVELEQTCGGPGADGESEILLCLHALSGRRVDPFLLPTVQDRGTLLRMQGQPEQALPYCPCPVARAEAHLAVGQPEVAERLLREFPALMANARAAENISDLLAFAGPRESKRRKEALFWRERALQLRLGKWPGAAPFLLEDLAQLSRAVAPLLTWLDYRGRASLSSGLDGPVDQLNRALEEGRVQLRTGRLGALRIKTAILSAETRIPMGHPAMEVARARAAHLLRQAGEWSEADDVLARGQLIQSLLHRVSERVALSLPQE